MYEKDGEKFFIVDGHVHAWDAGPANQANKYGGWFIDCFYDYHTGFTHPDYLWNKEQFYTQSEEQIMGDLFERGYVDKAIFQPTYLKDFYVNGFNTTEQNGVLAEKHPDKFILNGAWDPRDGEAGLDALEALKERYDIMGVKLYTAEWKGDSKGWKLSDDWAKRYLDKCQQLGIKNIHVHKGPTIRPLNRDAFDVADVDDAASSFPELNFIVEHCGLPRLEDFCYIAAQEPNVYGGLAVAMAFMHHRPEYFGKIMGELLFWLGEDRLLFASDYAIWQPKWMVEGFVDYQIPDSITSGDLNPITDQAKKKILGLNAAKLYNLDVPADCQIQSEEKAPVEEPAIS